MTDHSRSHGVTRRWSCPQCNYSAPPKEIFSLRKHFEAHSLECERCLYRTETKATWAEAIEAYNDHSEKGQLP